MTHSLWVVAISLLVASVLGQVHAQPPATPKADPAAIARQILDDTTPADRRAALIRDHAALAPELIAAMTADLRLGEEYRRIPWIWRVAIAAGRRHDPAQLIRILEVALPKDKLMRDWQAVVIGGGVINGLSLEKKWPARQIDALLKNNDALAERWTFALMEAHRMADAATVPIGTRYDALRMIALDSWENCGKRLAGYLKKGTNEELQMGAVSGLSDIDRPEIAALLADGLAHFPAANRKLAIEALLRTPTRRAVLKERWETGRVDKSWLDDAQRAALRSP